MKINLKGTGLDLTPSIKEYCNEKIGSLAKFVERYNTDGSAEIWVEIARTTKHHHKGLVFRAEADLRLPGKVLRAEHEDTDVRTAIDKIRNQLRLEILKYKTTHLVRRFFRWYKNN